MMPLRPALKFTDSWRTDWIVYEEAQCQDGCRYVPHCTCASECATVGAARALIFATDLVVRRVTPAPAGWWRATLAELEALCTNARPSERTITVDSIVSHLLSLPDIAPTSCPNNQIATSLEAAR